MNFVCVKAKPRYGAAYVNQLFKSVSYYYSGNFKFYCLTDDANGVIDDVICQPLQHSVTGWWHKIQVFQLSSELSEPICFFDLDTVIAGSLDFVDGFAGDFALLEDFYRPGGFQSSVMLLNNGFGKRVYDPFLDNPVKAMAACEPGQGPTWGDQRWIEMTVKKPDLLQSLWPGKFVSFKVDVRNTMQLPYGASVLCFHGEPRPHHFSQKVIR